MKNGLFCQNRQFFGQESVIFFNKSAIFFAIVGESDEKLTFLSKSAIFRSKVGDFFPESAIFFAMVGDFE
jgi:hypothetical protein